MNRWWLQLLPELRQFPPDERDAALRSAREEQLDLLELAGLLVALVVVTAVTNMALVEAGLAARGAQALFNFVVAFPLLALAVAPIHIRRIRRSLRQRLRSRGRT